MARFTRRELDDIGILLVRKAKELEPELNPQEMIHLFGRTYSNLLKRKKLDEQQA